MVPASNLCGEAGALSLKDVHIHQHRMRLVFLMKPSPRPRWEKPWAAAGWWFGSCMCESGGFIPNGTIPSAKPYDPLRVESHSHTVPNATCKTRIETVVIASREVGTPRAFHRPRSRSGSECRARHHSPAASRKYFSRAQHSAFNPPWRLRPQTLLYRSYLWAIFFHSMMISLHQHRSPNLSMRRSMRHTTRCQGTHPETSALWHPC